MAPVISNPPPLWKHFPWLLALLFSPLLYGSVDLGGQAVVGLLLGTSLVLLAPELGRGTSPVTARWLTVLGLVVLVLPLVPLPAGLVGALNPARVELAGRFPIEPGAAPAWLPLTLSPGGTLQRLWELALVIAGFALARQGMAHPRFPRLFVGTLAATILLLAASELWRRVDGRGWWGDAWGSGAGTFANRNHFANWIYLATLVCLGGVLRRHWPLRSARARDHARGTRTECRPAGRGAVGRPNHPTAGLRPADGEPPHDTAGPASGTGVAPPLTCRAGSGGKPEQPSSRRAGWLRERVGAVLLPVAIVCGLVAAVACGSRGGLLAWFVGLAVWLALLARRSRHRARWAAVGGATLVLFILMIVAGETVLGRLAGDTSSLTIKLRLWGDAWGVVERFPGFGTGWGTFHTAFGPFKSFADGTDCLHAENDYLQTLVESGLTGALVLGLVFAAGAKAVGGLVWRRRLAEPELVFGATAALAAFAAHACVEFVGQIPANALLAAALAGVVIGGRDAALRPAVPPPLPFPRVALNLAAALALLAGAGLHAGALRHWDLARRAGSPAVASAHLEKSVRLWPADARRWIALARAQAAQRAADPTGNGAESGLQPVLAPDRQKAGLHAADKVRARLDEALAWNPFHWELRLERAWLELRRPATGGGVGDVDRALDDLRAAAALNPGQPRIHLDFARQLAATHPDDALELLREAPWTRADHLREALALAWEMEPRPATLGSIAPDTVTGLLALGDFALERRLHPLAAEAFARLDGRVDPLLIAERLLEARQPALAREFVPQPPASTKASLLLAQAHLQAGNYAEAIRVAESVCLASAARGQWLRPVPTTPDPERRAPSRPEDPGTHPRPEAVLGAPSPFLGPEQHVGQWAERIFQAPPETRDLARLRELARSFPDQPRLAWLVFQTELDQHRYAEAAHTGLQLARRLAAQP